MTFSTFSTSPSTLTAMSSPCSLPPVLSDICVVAPRWRSPQLKRRPRLAWDQPGQSEPSAESRGRTGPLSPLAPGGCAGFWRPPWASASGAPGAPPGLARALHAPSLVSTPWRGRLKGCRETTPGYNTYKWDEGYKKTGSYVQMSTQ